MYGAGKFISDYGFGKFFVVLIFVFSLDYFLGSIIDSEKLKNVVLYAISIGFIVFCFYSGFF